MRTWWKPVRRAVGTLLLGFVLAIPFGIVMNLFVQAGPPGTAAWKTVLGTVVPYLLGLFSAAVWRGYLPSLRDSIRGWNTRQEDWLFEHPPYMVALGAASGVLLGFIITMHAQYLDTRLVMMVVGASFWGLVAWQRVRRYQRILADEAD